MPSASRDFPRTVTLILRKRASSVARRNQCLISAPLSPPTKIRNSSRTTDVGWHRAFPSGSKEAILVWAWSTSKFRVAKATLGSSARLTLRAVDREFPLEPEVALGSSLCMRRDQRNKERTISDLFADLRVPDVPAAQLASVEPDLDAALTQPHSNAPCGLGILRGIT